MIYLFVLAITVISVFIQIWDLVMFISKPFRKKWHKFIIKVINSFWYLFLTIIFTIIAILLGRGLDTLLFNHTEQFLNGLFTLISGLSLASLISPLYEIYKDRNKYCLKITPNTQKLNDKKYLSSLSIRNTGNKNIIIAKISINSKDDDNNFAEKNMYLLHYKAFRIIYGLNTYSKSEKPKELKNITNFKILSFNSNYGSSTSVKVPIMIKPDGEIVVTSNKRKQALKDDEEICIEDAEGRRYYPELTIPYKK